MVYIAKQVLNRLVDLAFTVIMIYSNTTKALIPHKFNNKGKTISRMDNNNKIIKVTLKQVRRFIVLVIGITILLIGIAMIVLPGPAVIVIPLGLSILAAEFVWAKRLLDKVKSGVKIAKDSFIKDNKGL